MGRHPAAGQPSALVTRHTLSRQTLLILHDVGAVVLALPLAIMLRENQLLTGDRLAYIFTCLPLLVAASLSACLMLGSYRAVWRYPGIVEVTRLAQFALLAVLLFWVGQFVVDRLADLPRSGPALQFLVAMFILIGSRIAYGQYCRWHQSAATARAQRQPLLLVGFGSETSLFIQMLAGRHDIDYKPVGIIRNTVGRHRLVNGVPVLGRLEDINRVLATLRVQGMAPARLVITRPHHELGREAVYHVMQRAYAHRIPVAQLPDLMRFKADGTPPSTDDPEPLPTSLYPRFKRAFDIAASATVLAFLSPLLALAAIAVAVGIQRPVLFVQIRPGLHRRPFRLLKLRTMLDPIDAAGRALSDAERTPLVGRLLRRTRLDELPQFWNVLKGDMAIIGPRPLIASDLDAMPDHGVARSRSRPGITGWAQVNGGHQLEPDDKLALDLWYTENACLALDARIVWRTIRVMLMGERRNERAIREAHDIRSPMVKATE